MVKMHGLLPVPPFLLQAAEGGRGEGEHEPGDLTMEMGPEVACGSQVGVRRPRQEGKEVRAGDTEEARLVSVLRGRAGCHSFPGTTEGVPMRGWGVTTETFPGTSPPGRGPPAVPSHHPLLSLLVAPGPSHCRLLPPPCPHRALLGLARSSSETRTRHLCGAAGL